MTTALYDLPLEILQLIFDILRRESTAEVHSAAAACLISVPLLQLGRAVLYTKLDVRHPRVRDPHWTPAIVETLAKQPELAQIVKHAWLDLARAHHATAAAFSIILPSVALVRSSPDRSLISANRRYRYLLNLHSLSITGFIPEETTTLFQQLIALPPAQLAKFTSLSLSFWTQVGKFPCVRLADDPLIILLPGLGLRSLALQGADLTGFEFPQHFRLELQQVSWENCEMTREASIMINAADDTLESLSIRYNDHSASTLFSPTTTFASLHPLPHLTRLVLQDVQHSSTIPQVNHSEGVESNEHFSERLKELFIACPALKWLTIGITLREGTGSEKGIDFHLDLLPPSLLHLEFDASGPVAVVPQVSDLLSWMEGGGGAKVRTLIVPKGETRELESICSSRGINLSSGKRE